MRSSEFYNFMRKRESLRLRKEAGEPWPWTDDPILQKYKFTNVKRANDRTTKWFWEEVLDKHQDAPAHVILFNCALFRYFGTIEFYEAIGWQSYWGLQDQTFVKLRAKDRLANKQRVFTGAYVITNQGIKAPKQDVVVDHFLTPFWNKCVVLAQVANETRSWEAVAKRMMKLKGFGGTGFMTKEVLQDAIHTSVLANCTDRNRWCPIGPGARRGLNRVYDRAVKSKVPDAQMLEEMRELWKMQTLRWPWDELELHDIQFQLCEFDKYERVLHGEGRPRNKYKRPK